jgi:methylated-DNA-[protein]-cysteine S-methyltransferase
VAYYEVLESPLGPIFVGGSAAGVHRIDFLGEVRDEADEVRRLERDAAEPAARDARAAAPVVAALRAYFAGASGEFALPLAARGTPFQRAVWAALLRIPAGSTASYGEVARAAGHPGAARATGAAIGRNPIAIVVPCHRVIGADGTLTGYASGLERKRWLLAHEAQALALALAPRAQTAPASVGADSVAATGVAYG